jgi:hypothetical protein
MSDLQRQEVGAIAQPLIAQINQQHAQCLGCDDVMRDVLIQKCNLAREVGLHLIELKKGQRHGKWLGLFSSHRGEANTEALLYMDASTGQNYMRFAVANPNPIALLDDAVRSLYDAMIACGAIAEPHRSGQQQRHALEPIGKLTKIGGSLTEVITRWTEDKPVSQWTREEREAAALQLEPIVRFYEEVRV